MLVRECERRRKTKGGVFSDRHCSPKGVFLASPVSSHLSPSGQREHGDMLHNIMRLCMILKWQIPRR